MVISMVKWTGNKNSSGTIPSKGRSGSNHSLNIIEEYMGAFRTKSFNAMWTRVQQHLNTTKTRPFESEPDCTDLLEPNQDLLTSILYDSHAYIPSLLLDFFNTSIHACNFCVSLIESVDKARDNNRLLRSALDRPEDRRDLEQFSRLSNPFSGPSWIKFQRIHEIYSRMQKKLTLAHRKAGRRVRLVNVAARAATCGVVDEVEGYWAAWEVVQLDAAARGAFALGRDFDTMGRMVERLADEIEHGREVIGLVLVEMEMEEGKGELVLLREVVRELQVSESWFMDQLAELEEHVYLCLLNINRVRRMVLEVM
ncbi:putative UPF0496 protein 2 [Typha latifolia]|uniref:putative UPF0496 protein 2 n=1 Tax=Typha latifolia TaxID=4733 RepID=UPI003C2CAF14